MPYDMQEVSGFQVKEVWPKTTNEDEMEAVVRFKGNAVASHVATDITMAGKDMIRIVGTKGAMLVTHGSCDVFTNDADGQRVKTSGEDVKGSATAIITRTFTSTCSKARS